MTKDRFFALLKEAQAKHPEYEVVFAGNGNLLRLNGPDGTFCPVTFVCYYETGAYFMSSEWEQAANAFGLSKVSAESIVEAADDWSEFEWHSATQRRISVVLGVA